LLVNGSSARPSKVMTMFRAAIRRKAWVFCHSALVSTAWASAGIAQTTPPFEAPPASSTVGMDRRKPPPPEPTAPPAYEVKVGALVQTDARAYVGAHDRDNVLLRRARPIVTGTLLDLVDFNFTADFGGGQVGLTDAYLNARPESWVQLRVGKFKPPIGLERLQSDAGLPLPERAMTSNLSATRDLGVQLWGTVGDGLFTYALALLDGAADNANIDQDVGGDKDLALRLCLEPLRAWPTFGVLGIGAAATTGRRNGSASTTSLAALRTPGQGALFSYLAPSDDPDGTGTVVAQGEQRRLNPEIYYYRGPIGVLGEIIWSREEVHKGPSALSLTHRALHATASYVIGGSNGYKGATPTSEWKPASGQLGAVEFAARYSAIRFDNQTFPTFADPIISARSAQNLGAAANWVLSRQVRLAVNFEHTRFRGGAATGDRADENFVLTRAQIAF
jgi:phosphate-selective porin OprO/OprP